MPQVTRSRNSSTSTRYQVFSNPHKHECVSSASYSKPYSLVLASVSVSITVSPIASVHLAVTERSSVGREERRQRLKRFFRAVLLNKRHLEVE